MSGSNDDEDGERPSKTAKLETDFSLFWCVRKENQKHSQNLKGSLLLANEIPSKVQTTWRYRIHSNLLSV